MRNNLFRFGLLFSAVFAATAVLSFNAFSQDPIPPPPDIDEPEKIFTEEIKLNVSAFDERGNFVSEVGKDDIVIIEDGRLHQPSSIRRIPANVLIVLDTGGEMRSAKGLRQTRKTAKRLLNSLAAEDSVAILEYNDKARIISEWTKDKSQTMQAIDRDLNFGKRSLFVEALELATGFLRKSENENRHLVLISDGTDSLGRSAEKILEMRRLQSTNINVHILSYTALEIAKVRPKTKSVGARPHKNPLPDEVVAGLPEPLRTVNKAPKFGTINLDRKLIRVMKKRKADLEDGEKFLAALADNTSGMFILPETKKEMEGKASLIAEIIDSNYVVTYTPKRPLSESPAGEVRTIEVSSRKEGLRVSARRKLIVEKN